LPSGARIDTDLGLVQDAGGALIDVPSVVVLQNAGTSTIRAFIAKSFVFDETTILGSNAFAVVAAGPITIRGKIDASANHITPGPGAQEAGSPCAGTSTMEAPDCGICLRPAMGAGGGGNATAGGAGGWANGPGGLGGAFVASFYPLVGGCRGGALLDDSGTGVVGNGGAGGGAVQLVSLESISLTVAGFIDVGGGGGQPNAGGGSGGTVILEAPTVSIDGASTGITANGGSGGGCYLNGTDGATSTAPAAAPSCTYSPGNGGTGSAVPGWGTQCTGSCVLDRYGGGGGAAGRLRIVTKDGTYGTLANPVISAAVSALALTPM
jgi:hypothetical protein